MEKEDLQQEFDLFIKDVNQEKCFFCGGDPVFITHMPISEQIAFFTCCESCMIRILGEAALTRLEFVKGKVTVH